MRTRILTWAALLVAPLLGCAVGRPALHHSLRTTPSALPAGELERLGEILVRQADAVVEIRTEFVHGGSPTSYTEDTLVVTESGGSGVVIDPDGLVLTNTHVIAGADRIFVRFTDGERQVIQWRPHPTLDLAVMKVAHRTSAALQPEAVTMRTGASVVALSGVPAQMGGAFGVVTRPEVCLQAAIAPNGPLDYRRLLECTAPLRPGFSGGPVFASTGEWIGISVAAAESPNASEARGYVIPLDRATCAAIADLAAGLGGGTLVRRTP